MRRIAIVWAGTLLVIGSAAIIFAAVWGAGAFQGTEVYHRAQVCSGTVPTPAADSNGCIATEFGVVTGRSMQATTDDGSYTIYDVDYRRASGAVESAQVTEALYDVATTGTRVQLETWQGSVVWIIIGDTSAGEYAPAEGILTACVFLAWIALGLVIWSLAAGGGVHHWLASGLRSFCWILSGFAVAQAAQWVLDYGLDLEVDAASAVLGLIGIGGAWLSLIHLRVYGRTRAVITGRLGRARSAAKAAPVRK
jgi:hypothetical protein